MSDLIDRREAINELWRALFDYEDKMEKDFQESEELDIGDWFVHCIFVQNMSDIDRNVILNLPSAQTEPKKGKWISGKNKNYLGGGCWRCSNCGYGYAWDAFFEVDSFNFCPNCGADMKGGNAK